MPNPYLPLWEYIPDGESRVFGDRVYVYGSHDHAGSDKFCDYKLKVWSASINDLNKWTCHGDIFHTIDDEDHRMTNGTIMSRRACVEKIELLPDGTIPQVEMTSLGFEERLSC